jgi:hypothetical protein
MAPGRIPALLLLVLVASPGLSACGTTPQEVRGGAYREGLAFPVGGIEYNVFITRELNPRVPPDKAFYQGPEPAKDQLLYGVFIQACNTGEKPRPTAEHFTVKDSEGTKFEPVELPKDNAFAYHPARLQPDQCVPDFGSVAQQGPTGASMLLFKIPLSNTENRPLELEIQSQYDVTKAKRETARVQLDI